MLIVLFWKASGSTEESKKIAFVRLKSHNAKGKQLYLPLPWKCPLCGQAFPGGLGQIKTAPVQNYRCKDQEGHTGKKKTATKVTAFFVFATGLPTDKVSVRLLN